MTMGRTKLKKQVPLPTKSKLKKDPGVPKLPDLKERVRQHNNGKGRIPPPQNPDADSIMAIEPTLSSLALLAASASSSDPTTLQQPEDYDPSSSSNQGKTREQLRKYYIRTLHKVIDESDVVILVLDARDPEGCRSRLVEEEVRRREAEGKRLVFVLNKIDLIPKPNALAWLKHLRHSTPTLPFLSSTQSQRSNISTNSGTAAALIKLLKAYKGNQGPGKGKGKASVTIGVVGYPNVGKSSLINTLKRSKVCPVAAQPGHTKDLQSVQLERGMRILDSPGVVFDDDDELTAGKGGKKGSVLLRNVVKVEDVDDPIEVVEEILTRTPPSTIQKLYNLPEYGSTIEFLTMLAMTRGRLLKGGTPDVNGAARHVLQDWNHQKIPYFSEPPEVHPSLIPSVVANASGESTIAPGAENVGQAQILTTFSKPFELEGLFTSADNGAFGGSKDVNMDEVADDGIEEDAFIPDVGEEMEMEDVPNAKEDEMMSSPSKPKNPLKRPRSPSISRPSTPLLSTVNTSHELPTYTQRLPKRLRRSNLKDSLDSGEVGQMEKSNPMSRRNLKRERKKERRAGRVRHSGAEGSMEIDEDIGNSFMA